jgi:FkbM family methyltransferase
MICQTKAMNLARAIRRVKPLQLKLSGKLPLCPWPSVFTGLDPRTIGVFPPRQNIEILQTDGKFQKLRFDDKHEVWFPGDAKVTPEVWNEYLCVFWNHPQNAHYYLRHVPVKAGDVCVDCGACEGFFVFQALEADASKVICVEPSAIMAQCLARTFEREIAGGRVVIKHAALGAINGTIGFNFDSLHPFGGSVGQQSGHAETVEVLTLERLLVELGVSRIDFLKMDIEGAEIQAVEGAMPTLTKYHPKSAVTTYHRSFDFVALRALLIAAGYQHIKPVGITGRDDGVYRPVMLHAWVSA